MNVDPFIYKRIFLPFCIANTCWQPVPNKPLVLLSKFQPASQARSGCHIDSTQGKNNCKKGNTRHFLMLGCHVIYDLLARSGLCRLVHLHVLAWISPEEAQTCSMAHLQYSWASPRDLHQPRAHLGWHPENTFVN